MVPPTLRDYAGDISAAEAWERLEADPAAQLVDVRTVAEWNFVGLPDLAPLGRRAHTIEWQNFPGMAPNPALNARWPTPTARLPGRAPRFDPAADKFARRA